MPGIWHRHTFHSEYTSALIRAIVARRKPILTIDYETAAEDERMSIERIAVVGAGLMGHGIAQVFAQAGLSVRLSDTSLAVLEEAMSQIQRNLQSSVERGYSGAGDAAQSLARIQITESLAEAVDEADFVVESVYEEMSVKHEVLRAIEALCPAEAILASNSSSFRVGDMGVALIDGSRFVGTHFWNPPYLIPVVEVTCGPETSPECVDTTCALLSSIGKRPAVVRKDVAGFVGNRLQHALRREAIALVEAGVATAEDIDLIARFSFGLRMPLVGPLETVDLAGLDLTLAIQRYLLPDLNQETEPSPLIVDKVAKGDVGAKSGQGFYAWTEETHEEAIRRRDRALYGLLEWLRTEGYGL
jgi:3-hydroxybutyryl-CoA dehydrogenase